MNEVKKYKNMEEMQEERQKDYISKNEIVKQLGANFVVTNLIGFKKEHPDAIIPTKAEPEATGYDLSSVEDVVIEPGEHKLVSTGLKWEAKGYDLSIRPRSGLAAKNMITVLNTPGSVDSSYRGILKVILINHSKTPFKVEKGMRIAQAVFHKVENVVIGELEELSDTIRGEGGMGSTGK
jgi:dUTP pyrophosphatase